ncbi:MAG: metal ABC transporter substrate-binding protein [Pseudomonadota bacterium]
MQKWTGIIYKFVITMAITGTALFSTGITSTYAATKPVRITTSFYPMYIATLNVAKGVPGVEVRNLTKPMTGCLHDYSITTDDMKQLSKTDIFIVNGAGMESFLDKVVKQLPKIKIVSASDGIELIKGAEGDNPHIWVSVSLHIKQIRNVASKLAEADPPHAKQYSDNAAAYVAKLEKLRAEMHKGLDGLKTHDIITFHEAFPYFAKEFGLNIAAVIEREPGSEPNAKELAATITLVKKAKVTALFAEPQYPAKAAQTIARETGAKLYTLDPAVTGSMKDDAYIRIMTKNLSELQKALK